VKRRDFLRANGVSAATTIAIGVTDDEKLEAAIGMDDDVDPCLNDFVDLLNSMMSMEGRPGWIVVPDKTYRMLEMELVPQCRYMSVEVANHGYENLLIKGIPVIPLRRKEPTQ